MSEPGFAGWLAEHWAKPSVADAIPMPPVVREALDELAALTARQEVAAARGEANVAELERIARWLAETQQDVMHRVEAMRVLHRQCAAALDRAERLHRADAEARRRECGITSAEMDAIR
jgi:hypothetical protein